MSGQQFGQPNLNAFGQPHGQFGGQQFGQGNQQFGQPNQQFGQPNLNAFGQGASWGQQGWGQSQRQLSQQDVGEVVRQLVPILPQILAQAQPMQAMG